MSDHLKKHVTLVVFVMATSAIVFVGICALVVVCKPFIVGEIQGQARLSSNNLIDRYDITYPVGFGEKADALIRGYTVGYVDDMLARHKTDKASRSIYRGTYKILHHGIQTATIIFARQYAGSPKLTSQNIITFDLQQVRTLNLFDVLTVGGQAKLGVILYDYFKSIYPTTLSTSQCLGLVQLKGIKDFSLGSNMITLYVDGESGVKTVSIKKELLGGILKPTYVAPDREVGDDNHRRADFEINSIPKHIDPTQKMLALTFDDGPGVYTAGLLDVLKQYQSHATFFTIGRQVSTYPLAERQIIASGSEIGNHSWDHAHLPLLPPGQLAQEITNTQQAISSATGGYLPTLMRPPYGEMNGSVNATVSAHGLRIALWNVDTEDWLYRDAQLVCDRILSNASDGGVILLHDIHPTSVEAAKCAIPQLVARGYQLVTMSELHQYR